MSSPTTSSTMPPMRTVVVLGVSYGGARAAQMLAAKLPANYRVLAIDRNSHMNHVYVFPRYIGIPRLAPKGFIPYTRLFETPPAPIEFKRDTSSTSDGESDAAAQSQSTAKALPTPPMTRDASPTPSISRHQFIQGNILSLSRNSLALLTPDAAGTYDDVLDDGSDAPPERLRTIDFDYCVHALGAGLPAPCDLWGEYGREQDAGRGTKDGGRAWIEKRAAMLAQDKVKRILLVGAGALGIQFATDLKELYPEKEITLLHSRARVLPRYPQEMHDTVIAALEGLGVNVVFGERVTSWPADPAVLSDEPKFVRTDKGSEFTADIVLACTGQKPHVELVRSLGDVVAESGRIRVKNTMQVGGDQVAGGPDRLSLSSAFAETPAASLDHFFAIGDCADTTAIQAGHAAYMQGEVAARNLVRLVEAREKGDGAEPEALETYTPGPPAIKVTLGLKQYAMANGDEVTRAEDPAEDLSARLMWQLLNVADLDDEA